MADAYAVLAAVVGVLLVVALVARARIRFGRRPRVVPLNPLERTYGATPIEAPPPPDERPRSR
jgi:hypothetical protein